MKTVFCFIDYHGVVRFFRRLSESDVQCRYVFFTTSYVAYNYMKRHHKEVYLVRVPFFSRGHFSYKVDEILPVKLGYASKYKCNAVVSSAIKIIEGYIDRHEIEKLYFFVWNGEGISGVVADYIKNKYECQTCYFEISNLPGKIFVDPIGVNKKSMIMKTGGKVLDSIHNPVDNFDDWRRLYFHEKINYSKETLTIPRHMQIIEVLYQAIFGVRNFSWGKVADSVGGIMGFSRRSNITPVMEVTRDKVFTLFPLQVRTDTQLVLNSSVSMRDVLNLLLSKSSEMIVLRPHPHDLYAVEELFQGISEVDRKRVLVSYEPTLELASYASTVVVINSTVGLECLILGSDVKFYGDSFYEFINNDLRLSSYINSYLFDVEFYSSDKISSEIVVQLFDHIDRLCAFNNDLD